MDVNSVKRISFMICFPFVTNRFYLFGYSHLNTQSLTLLLWKCVVFLS